MKNNHVLKNGIWITRGITRSLIVNGKTGQFMLIPNNIGEILSKTSFKPDDFGEDYEFFDYLYTQGYFQASIDSKNFSFSANEFPIRDVDSTLIIDIDENSNVDLLCDRLKKDETTFEYIQLRIFSDKMPMEQLLSTVSKSAFNGVELAVNFELDACDFFIKFPKLYYIQIFGQGYSDVQVEGMKVVEHIEEKLINESSCGNLCNRNFVYSSQFKANANQGNSCLKNKFAIDRNGNYGNCPSMKAKFGSITDTSINTAMQQFNNSSEKMLTEVTKSQVEECKDCEFRDVCVDCRAFRISEDIYSKPKKCNYNPFTGKWIAALLLFILSGGLASAQQSNFVIVDSVNLTPVPFCKVLLKKSSSVIYSDENGYFNPNISSVTSDSLIFIAYGYKTIERYFDVNSRDTVFLIPDERFLLLNEVVVEPRKWYDFTLNEFKKPEFGNLSLQKGGIIATYIHNSQFAHGRVNKVDVFIKSLDSTYNLRMKLFNFDVVKNCPGQEIKTSDYSIDFTGEAKWYSIVIKDTVFIPQNGICVGFEAIPKDNYMRIEKNQCGISSVVFSSYYEKLENGNRTSFTSLQSNDWYTPHSSDLKVDNVLNLSVRMDVRGDLNVPDEKQPNFISSRKVTRKLNAKEKEKILNHATIEELFKSVVFCIENNDLTLIAQLIKVDKAYRKQFVEFIQQNENNWLTESERNEAIDQWGYFVTNLDSAYIEFLSEDYTKITFPNGSSLFLYREIDGWKVSPYYKKLVH